MWSNTKALGSVCDSNELSQCQTQEAIRVPKSLVHITWEGQLWINDMVNYFLCDVTKSKQTESSREARMKVPLRWMRSTSRTQWGNLHLHHDRSCDTGQTLPAWHSPIMEKRFILEMRKNNKQSFLLFWSWLKRLVVVCLFLFTLQSMSTLWGLRARWTMPCLFINSRPSRTS